MATARAAVQKLRRKIVFFLVEHKEDVGGHLGRRTEAGEQQEDAGSRKHINLTFD